jgi:DNA-binding PadR family transcriptional regulator
MEPITNTELALLGLIMEQPRHAYEIEQVIEQRNMRYWTEIGFSSIYRILTRLEEAGLLSAELQPAEGRGPARKVYQLTDSGRIAWQQAALHTLAEPERRSSSFLLGLDSLPALPPEEALQALQANLERQQAAHQAMRAAVEAHPMRGDIFIDIFFDYLLEQQQAEIRSLETVIRRLETHFHNEEHD